MTDSSGEFLPVKHLLIGGGGSIGLVYLPATIIMLQSMLPGIEITVVLTRNAATLIPPSTFAVLTRRPCFCEWKDAAPGMVPHVELTDWADLLLVMPATANLLGKAAAGIADDVLTSCILAAACPIVFVPSMNLRMWRKPVVQRNVDILRQSGSWVLDPAEGVQAATGQVGLGSMPPLREILRELARIMRNAGME